MKNFTTLLDNPEESNFVDQQGETSVTQCLFFDVWHLKFALEYWVYHLRSPLHMVRHNTSTDLITNWAGLSFTADLFLQLSDCIDIHFLKVMQSVLTLATPAATTPTPTSDTSLTLIRARGFADFRSYISCKYTSCSHKIMILYARWKVELKGKTVKFVPWKKNSQLTGRCDKMKEHFFHILFCSCLTQQDRYTAKVIILLDVQISTVIHLQIQCR